MKRFPPSSIFCRDIMHALDLVGLVRAGVLPSSVHAKGADYTEQVFPVTSPIDGEVIFHVAEADSNQAQLAINCANQTFMRWRQIPAPRRGELIRQFGQLLREHKNDLANLIVLECGKITSEAQGEVQEMIDICDFAVGLSRQLHGLTIASEREEHRMMEQWHPLGTVVIVTAFNFPMAVWAWNAALALVCGNCLIWKPSQKTPLCAIACQRLLELAIDQCFADRCVELSGLSCVLNGGERVAQQLIKSKDVALVSATGSVPMGRAVAQNVAKRLGRCLLELGGNNALIVTESANLSLAVRAIVFSAVGTCGQRCTSLRRLFVHEAVADKLLQALVDAYRSLIIGDPRDPDVLVGPLIDMQAQACMQAALTELAGRSTHYVGGEVLDTLAGAYVRPAVVEVAASEPLLQRETFAPLLYVVRYRNWGDVIKWHNGVPQGLSSAIFTDCLQEAEQFISVAGSDCGIANVNIGTSGAEIGGAFGGEKDTGGGRESGSDAWKNYMRRATNTINFGFNLPLAQGVKFDT